MEWSPKQKDALDACAAWIESPAGRPVFRLFGTAGTGKTTLAVHLAQGVKRVRYAAYTWKAAMMMRRYGCDGATSIHNLIYKPVDADARDYEDAVQALAKAEESGNEAKIARARRRLEIEEKNLERPSFLLNPDSVLSGGCDLVVLDEVSMVDRYTAADLLSFKVPILALGDPFQLPPPKNGQEGYFTQSQPDVLLTEPHRFALDSPIVRLATEVRTKAQAPRVGQYGWASVGGAPASVVLDRLSMTPQNVDDMIREHDQVLVGLNATRHKMNRRARAIRDVDPHSLPRAGERLVCLSNNREAGVYNGTTWTAADDAILSDDGEVLLKLIGEDDQKVEVSALKNNLVHGYEPKRGPGRERGIEMDFGYAMTVHKSQGSQWGRVALFDESSYWPGMERWRWLYTGITRAAQSISLVRMPGREGRQPWER